MKGSTINAQGRAMLIFIAGLILFFAAHSVSIVNEPWRNRMVERLGLLTWLGLYALVSLAGLVLAVMGYGIARQTPTVLYMPPAYMHYITYLLMLPVFTLFIAAYIPGRIRSATRHPMLLSVMFWSVAHLLSTGTLADLILFGSFLIWAVIDRISMTRRIQRPIPEIPAGKLNDVIAVVAGLGIYAAFLFGLHGWLIGVPLMG